ncbi:MAG: hypothetical protein ACRDNF_13495 [Streptosporangiaceae bacterium]
MSRDGVHGRRVKQVQVMRRDGHDRQVWAQRIPAAAFAGDLVALIAHEPGGVVVLA